MLRITLPLPSPSCWCFCLESLWWLRVSDRLRLVLRGSIIAVTLFSAYPVVVDAVKEYRVRADVPIGMAKVWCS